ncbi:MAG: zinc-ribbon domain-containing protein [Candidatus Binataceae bacterium]
MIEIQCTSCHTRYRIDERVLPDETPTFKCSRCGHVFNAEPVAARPRKPPTFRVVEKPKAEPPPSTSPPEPEPDATPEPEREPEPKPIQAQSNEEPAHFEAPEVAEPPPENPLDRNFAPEPEHHLESGENLSFDFAEDSHPKEEPTESAEAQAPEEDRWEVGEPPEDIPEPRAAELHETSPQAKSAAPKMAVKPPSRKRDAVVPEFREPEFAAATSAAAAEAPRASGQRADIPDDVAYFSAPRPTHSAAWFLGLFVVVAMIFAGASLAVHMEPIAVTRMLSQAPRIGQNFQRPIVPAMLVALHDVHADYERIKGGQTALLISGTAENVGTSPLHAVLLAVDLVDDAGQHLASNAAFCGNGLTAKMVGEMTPREIEFLQRLDPQKNFSVDPSHTAPFLLVFIDPPPKITNLRIQVAKAVAAQDAPGPRS